MSIMEEGEFGPFDGTNGPYPTKEGRFDWIDRPMSVGPESDYNGSSGPWEPALGVDGQKTVGPIGAEGMCAPDYFMRQVEGWDSNWMSSRRPDFE